VLVAAIVVAYRLEQVDLSETNPAPAGAPDPVRLSARLLRSKVQSPKSKV
jgi:hypothetical protein